MGGRTTLASDRRRRKTITAIWLAGLSLGVVLLIYWEQSAILYILATLGITALLAVVAMSDLSHTDKTSGQLSPTNDASAIANGVTSSYRNTPSK
jgi:hypothetical protein